MTNIQPKDLTRRVRRQRAAQDIAVGIACFLRKWAAGEMAEFLRNHWRQEQNTRQLYCEGQFMAPNSGSIKVRSPHFREIYFPDSICNLEARGSDQLDPLF